MTGKGYLLSALGMVLAWDLLRPDSRVRSWGGKNPRRRLRIRSFDVCIDGEWHSFPSYRSYRRYLREAGRASAGVHPHHSEPLDALKAAFIEGRNIAIDNAAMMAYDMGHPDVRDAINALVERDAES